MYDYEINIEGITLIPITLLGSEAEYIIVAIQNIAIF